MCTRREAAMIVAELSRGIAVGVSRHDISEKNWQIGDLAAELLLEHGIVVSPLVENRDHSTVICRFFHSAAVLNAKDEDRRLISRGLTYVRQQKSAFNGSKNKLRQKGDSPGH